MEVKNTQKLITSYLLVLSMFLRLTYTSYICVVEIP